MTNKIKFILPVLALSMMFGSVAFAQTDGTNTSTSGDTATTVTTTRKECVATARTTRMSAVKAAQETAKEARMTAKSTRDASVATAKANPDKKAGALAAKTARATYRATLADIAKTLRTSTKTAWDNYATAVKACPKK
jgi:hypothetical protein